MRAIGIGLREPPPARYRLLHSGRIAQLVRALASHARGLQFESGYAHETEALQIAGFLSFWGQAILSGNAPCLGFVA